MNKNDYIEKGKIKLRETAKLILKNKINWVEGCRLIVNLQNEIDEQDNEIFNFIRFLESETDDIPIGQARNFCDEAYLKKIDKEIEAYREKISEDLIKSCNEIIEYLSQ